MQAINQKYTGKVKPSRRQMTKDQLEAEKKAIFKQIETMKADPTKGVSKPLFSTPNCQHILKDSSCEYQDDFNKNFQDPRA